MGLPIHSLPVAVYTQFGSIWKTPFRLIHARPGKKPM